MGHTKNMKIIPNRGRILVKLSPAIDDIPNSLNLTLVDQKKHFDHTSRRGIVEAVGLGVTSVAEGDEVVFAGPVGKTMDFDAGMDRNFDESEYRWLKAGDVLAVVDREQIKLEVAA